MLAVPKIPYFKHGDILTSNSINHIIKRIEYGANLLEKIEIGKTIRFAGSAVGYSYLGNDPLSKRIFLYKNGGYSDIKRNGYPTIPLSTRGISGKLVIGQNYDSDGKYWTYSDGVFFDRVLPTGYAFQMRPNGIYGNWVVGIYRPSIFINGYGFATNIQTNEMITIVHPDTNNTNQALAINGNSVLGFGDKTVFNQPNKSFRIFYIYNLKSNPNKRSSYKTVRKFFAYNTPPNPLYTGIGPNDMLSGAYYDGTNLDAFYSTGTTTFIEKTNRSFKGKVDSLYPGNISGNYLSLNAYSRGNIFQENLSIGYAYGINSGRAIPIVPSYATSSYLTGIDIG